MAYWAIEVSPELSADEYAAAVAGEENRELVQDQSTEEMLEDAGFVIREARDVTAEYLDVAKRWIDGAVRMEEPLRAALGDAVYDERLSIRRGGHQLTSRGLHRRMFYVADPQ